MFYFIIETLYNVLFHSEFFESIIANWSYAQIIFLDCFAGQEVLIKDPTVWLDGVRTFPIDLIMLLTNLQFDQLRLNELKLKNDISTFFGNIYLVELNPNELLELCSDHSFSWQNSLGFSIRILLFG